MIKKKCFVIKYKIENFFRIRWTKSVYCVDFFRWIIDKTKWAIDFKPSLLPINCIISQRTRPMWHVPKTITVLRIFCVGFNLLDCILYRQLLALIFAVLHTKQVNRPRDHRWDCLHPRHPWNRYPGSPCGPQISTCCCDAVYQ